MKTKHNSKALEGSGRAWLGSCILATILTTSAWAQNDVPQLLPGAPNPFTPTNAAWNRNAAYTPGGGVLQVRNQQAYGVVSGYIRQNSIGAGIAPLTSQYGVGDVLLPPEDALALFSSGWVPIIGSSGTPWAVAWLEFANTNLFVAVDEGVASVIWSNIVTMDKVEYTYVIGPNLTRRPVRLFWTEGQYAGPRVRFGSSYYVKLHYNTQLKEPTAADLLAITEEKLGNLSGPRIFIKNSELRATPGAKGRICLTYSRRPEGSGSEQELLGFEVVDVLEPMSSTLSAYVGDRLLPKNQLNPTNALFSDITRGAVDQTGVRPDEIFAYKHSVGRRAGWVWAIRPTDAPWQLEIFWKAKEQLDVIWPFEVDIYAVQWNPETQLCAESARTQAPVPVYMPQQVLAEVMPYQGVETTIAGETTYPKGSGVAVVSGRSFIPGKPGLVTLKYTIGDDVWFEPIRIVGELSTGQFGVYQGVQPQSIGNELRPFLENGGLAGERYDAWPGLLRIPDSRPANGNGILNVDADARWDRYHPGLYAYPVSYPNDTNSIQSQIFAVNAGHLSAWWWNPTSLVENDDFPVPIYWPSLVCDYRNEWPVGGQQLVIASFQGSMYSGLFDDGTAGLEFTQPPVRILGGPTVTAPEEDGGWGNPAFENGFTFESWINPAALEGQRGIMTMTSASGSDALTLVLKNGLIGAMVTSYGAGVVVTQEWYGNKVVSNEWTHVGLVYGPTEGLQFYVDGEPAGGETNSIPAGLGGYMATSVQLGVVGTWLTNGAPAQFGAFQGWMDESRMWGTERSKAEIWQYFGAVVEPAEPGLVFRFSYGTTNSANPLDLTGLFYISSLQPGFVEIDPSEEANVMLQRGGKTYPTHSPRVYVQNNKDLPGFNPNEEHALMVGSAVYAIRMDLNDTNTTSPPFTLLEYTEDPKNWRRSIDVYEVVATNADFPRFVQNIEAGRMIQPPYPLKAMLPDNCRKTYTDDPLKVLEDRREYFWAKQARDDGDHLKVGMRFFYPVIEGFYFPQFDTHQPKLLTEVPWLSAWGLEEPSPYTLTNGTPVRVEFDIRWPENLPTLYTCETLTKAWNKLPAVRGQKSVGIPYQQSMKQPNGMASVVLIDPTAIRKVGLETVPKLMRTTYDPLTANTFFQDLEPDLRQRLYWRENEAAGYRLQLKGVFVEYPNYHYLRLNVLTDDAYTNTLDPKFISGMDNSWTNAIEALRLKQLIFVPNENDEHDSLALCTTGLGEGYVTLMFNNATNINVVDPGDPIDMAVIKVSKILWGGRIDTINSDNPLDKYVLLRHISDFAGEPNKWEFQWQWASPENGAKPATNSPSWATFVGPSRGTYSTLFGSSGESGLADKWVRCRYRALDQPVRQLVGTNWSQYTEPAFCEGWIKRVLKAINPFDQRIRNYMQYALNTELSMIQQAGQPYAGDVPLNLNALNDYGLIPLYQTVLEQGKGLSIDATLDTNGSPVEVCLALMLAAGRLNDFYMVLGNEAYADAMNPSISLGTTDPVLSAEASSIFAFQNVVPTLLDEELALLRGRDCSDPLWSPSRHEFPIHNRLPWNITYDITHGQPAYVLNYGISDLKGDKNGVVDAFDAAKLYPQGHGDAWGHYLSALKSYYYLFQHRNFSWIPKVEGIRVGTLETTMSALHEIKFAGAAAAKARAGLAIMERTYAREYQEGSSTPWSVQRDYLPDRAWGVGEWGARVGMGAYFDWLMANTLLPDSSEPDVPLRMINRTTVPELTQIVLAAADVQQIVDMADRGMNPLGLAPAAVPFDISPSEIDRGNTHFEQAFAKAKEALKVTKGVFDRIQTATGAIRDQNEQRDLDTVVTQQEQAFERRLIEIYGYPYEEDKGVGKPYPQDYNGADLIHFNYITRYDYFGNIPMDTASIGMDMVVPNIREVLTVPANTILPRPPPPTVGLTIEEILMFINPEYAATWEQLKKDYAEQLKDVSSCREDLASLGIPELLTFYDEVYNKYVSADALAGLINEAVSFFDGVLSVPVDAIDQFISEWVGPETTLTPVNVAVPNISYTTNRVVFWIGGDGLPSKPADYVSNRRAEGEIQVALSQYVLALRELSEILSKSRSRYNLVVNYDSQFRNTVSAQLSAYYDKVNALDNMNSLQKTIEIVNKSIAMVNKVYDTGMEVYAAFDAALPTVMGTSFDVKAIVAGVERIITAGVNTGNLVQKLANQEQITSTERDLEVNQRIIALNAEGETIFKDSQAAAQAVIASARTYVDSLFEIDVVMQKAETARMQYARAIAAGDMIQVEREQARRIWATDLTGRRYRNMAYQIIRNDDLARYEETFAMARKYVYLAAKAYDYETGLLRHDGSVGEPGREFLSQIVRARALGRFTADGIPLPGGSTGEPGLADILARMSANWSVLDGRLNFNNPQVETGTFSLRKELFRIPNGDAFDVSWRDILATYKVTDVRSLQEYRTHCLPFNPSYGVEPALVIPLSTTINFRENFFGLPLTAGDNAYDSTHFSTKVRGIGVWFSNYQNTTLANQPRVYLVPLGEDRMRVPDGVGETIRSWSILDQALPIPYQLSNESWMRPDWNVRTDVLGGEFFARRRLPGMRAYHDSGFNVSEMVTNSRLVGRSVWNTRWLLIIPGGTLLADADKGVEQFIRGRELAPGSKTYDGQGVKDIKLQFLTYSYSGN